jgi:hypothetical protein
MVFRRVHSFFLLNIVDISSFLLFSLSGRLACMTVSLPFAAALQNLGVRHSQPQGTARLTSTADAREEENGSVRMWRLVAAAMP